MEIDTVSIQQQIFQTNHVKYGENNSEEYFINGCGSCQFQGQPHDMLCDVCRYPRFAFHSQCLKKVYKWSVRKIEKQKNEKCICIHCEKRLSKSYK